jgi:hypothetical protein
VLSSTVSDPPACAGPAAAELDALEELDPPPLLLVALLLLELDPPHAASTTAAQAVTANPAPSRRRRERVRSVNERVGASARLPAWGPAVGTAIPPPCAG